MHFSRLILFAAWASCCFRLEADDAIPRPEIVAGQPVPTLRLAVWHGVNLGGNCGYLYVTGRDIRYQVLWPSWRKGGTSDLAWKRSEIAKIESTGGGLSSTAVHITLKTGKRYTFGQVLRADGDCGADNAVDSTYLLPMLQDFNGALAAARSAPAPDTASGAATSEGSVSSDAAAADSDQTGVFVDGARGAFAGKRLIVQFFNGCGAGDPDFQLLQQTVADQLFAPGRFASSAGAKPELILKVTLTRLAGIDAATDAMDIFGMADADAHAAASFQLTDPGGKVIRSGTVVGHVSDQEDDDGSPHRSDAIKKLAISLASYLAQ